MHAIYQHFSELIEQAVIQLCPNLFLNFPAAAELQVYGSAIFDISNELIIYITFCSINSYNWYFTCIASVWSFVRDLFQAK